MVDYPFIIRNVTNEEFEKIKNCEDFFIKDLKENGKGTIKIKYNAKRYSIGIFCGKNDKESKLILSLSDARDIGGEEMAGCINRIYESLLNRLDEIRIPSEKWED